MSSGKRTESAAHIRDQLMVANTKLEKIRELYNARCEATVDIYTDGEEMFLANLSEVLNDE